MEDVRATAHLRGSGHEEVCCWCASCRGPARSTDTWDGGHPTCPQPNLQSNPIQDCLPSLPFLWLDLTHPGLLFCSLPGGFPHGPCASACAVHFSSFEPHKCIHQPSGCCGNTPHHYTHTHTHTRTPAPPTPGVFWVTSSHTCIPFFLLVKTQFMHFHLTENFPNPRKPPTTDQGTLCSPDRVRILTS
jgi:hypothetical protein